MELFSKQTNIDFMGKRRYAVVFSAALVVLAIGSLVVRGVNFGLDFTGGTLIEVGYPEAPEISDVRAALSESGFEDAVVQTFGAASDIVVRLPPRDETESNAELSTRVLEALQARGGGEVEIRRVEYVGPQIGRELAEKGGLAMLYALLGILVYVSLRFQWRFSIGAVTALVHDVTITIGLISLLQVQFDLTVIAALLAVIGYSLNDTIVVFDRIRENFRSMRKGTSFEVINASVNQTLSRTLVTSGTTLLVLLALFFVGGEIIHAFATTLIMGVLVGTYSSIYVASSAALQLGVSKQDLMPVEKEGAEAQGTEP